MELNMEAGYASRWQELLAQLAPDRRRAMEFLRDHLPLSDLDCYPAELFLRFADHALALRFCGRRRRGAGSWRRIFLTTTFSSRG